MKRIELILGLLLTILPSITLAESIAIGLANKDKVLVYADSSRTATILDTLEFTEHALVLGMQLNDEYSLNRWKRWIQVELTNGRSGWARNEDLYITIIIYVSSPQDSLFEQPSRGARFFQAYDKRHAEQIVERRVDGGDIWLGRRNRSWLLVKRFDYTVVNALYQMAVAGFKLPENYEKALAVTNRLESLISPFDTVYVDATAYNHEAGVMAVGAGALVAEIKHSVYWSRQQFDKTILELRKITTLYDRQPFFLGKAGAQAALRIADIYHTSLQDTIKAIAQYHEMIKNYPNEPLEGFEWNDWADDRAARAITEILAQKPVQLYDESDRIIMETTIPAIKLRGYAGKVRSFGLRRLTTAMIDTALAAIQKYPNVQRGFYLSTFDYANHVASTAFSFLEQQADIEKFNQLSDQLQRQFHQYPVAAAAALRKANLAYKTDGNLETLNMLYRKVVDEFGEFRIWDSVIRDDLSNWSAINALSQLKESRLTQAEVAQNEAKLKVGFDDQYPVMMILPAGTRAKVLYSDKSSNYVKIELKDGKAGWISHDDIKLIRDPVFQPNKFAKPVWNMALANGENNPVFAGPEINQTKLAAVLDNYLMYGLRFYDVNGDNTLDLLLRNKQRYGEIVALDGKSQQALWRIRSEEQQEPVVAEDKLYRNIETTDAGRPAYKIAAHNLKDGALLWTTAIISSRPEQLFCTNGKIYFANDDYLLQCNDGRTGEWLWNATLGEKIRDQRRPVIAVNQTALVAVKPQSLWAIHPLTGKILWQRQVELHRWPTVPVLDSENVYLYSNFELMAIRLRDGEVIWKNRAKGAVHPALVAGQRVFCSSSDGVQAVDKSNGRLLWQNPNIENPNSMIAVGSSIYLLGRLKDNHDQQGTLIALNQSNGEMRWTLPLASGRQLIYQSGRFFLEGQTGVVAMADSAAVAKSKSSSP